MRYRRRPTLAFFVVVVALSLLAAGCGGSPRVANVATTTVPGGAGSAATTSRSRALLLAGRCLREHGLANLPDPAIATSGPAKGQAILDKQALHAFSQSVVIQAMAACTTVLQKAGFSSGSDVKTPQQIQDGLAFARCVRRHGISNFPDPNGQGNFDLAGTGINSHSLTPAQLAAATAYLSAAHRAVHIPAQNGSTSNG